MTSSCNDRQRRILLARLRAALGRDQPHCHCAERPRLGQIEHHLDRIVDVMRRYASDAVELLPQILRQEICATCQYQSVSGYCPLRAARGCLLHRHAELVFDTVWRAMPLLDAVNDGDVR